MVFDWEGLYGEIGKPKPESPKPAMKKPEVKPVTLAFGLAMIFLGIIGATVDSLSTGIPVLLIGSLLVYGAIRGFSLSHKRDPNTWWGFEPRAGIDPDRGGGI